MYYAAKGLHAAYVGEIFFPPLSDIFTKQKRLRKPFKEC